jgi:enoyl-CoA hydratase/carnithine racemase
MSTRPTALTDHSSSWRSSEGGDPASIHQEERGVLARARRAEPVRSTEGETRRAPGGLPAGDTVDDPARPPCRLAVTERLATARGDSRRRAGGWREGRDYGRCALIISNELVRERRGSALVLRLNRPEVRNALNESLIDALGRAVAEAEADRDVRVVVITGTGDRAFCSGEDLRPVAAGGTPPTVHEGFIRLLDGRLSVPVVAAVNATAVAAGFEILLGCDVVVASSAARFGLPEVKVGLFAGAAVRHIAGRLPLGVALELVLTGDSIDARRAHELGLVNRVVPPRRVLDEALAVATRIGANAPLAVQASKALVRQSASAEPGFEACLEEWVQRVFHSDDAREGASAFLEKRAPNWRGR